jgi:TATA-binding protein-associated factor
LSFKREVANTSHYRSSKDKDSTPSEEVLKARLTRRGAHRAFVELSTKFGPDLFHVLPAMWECMCGSLLATYRTGSLIDCSIPIYIVERVCVDNPKDADEEMEHHPQKGQDVVDNLVILDAIVPTFHELLWSRLYDLFPQMVFALRSQYAVIRQLAAQSFATICDVATPNAMRYVIDHVLPLLGDTLVLTNRQGAIELIYRQCACLGMKLC